MSFKWFIILRVFSFSSKMFLTEWFSLFSFPSLPSLTLVWLRIQAFSFVSPKQGRFLQGDDGSISSVKLSRELSESLLFELRTTFTGYLCIHDFFSKKYIWKNKTFFYIGRGEKRLNVLDLAWQAMFGVCTGSGLAWGWSILNHETVKY